jgi:hypothetical protein
MKKTCFVLLIVFLATFKSMEPREIHFNRWEKNMSDKNI